MNIKNIITTIYILLVSSFAFAQTSSDPTADAYSIKVGDCVFIEGLNVFKVLKSVYELELISVAEAKNNLRCPIKRDYSAIENSTQRYVVFADKDYIKRLDRLDVKSLREQKNKIEKSDTPLILYSIELKGSEPSSTTTDCTIHKYDVTYLAGSSSHVIRVLIQSCGKTGKFRTYKVNTNFE